MAYRKAPLQYKSPLSYLTLSGYANSFKSQGRLYPGPKVEYNARIPVERLTMLLFRNKVFVAVTFGHLIIDVFNSMGTILVTYLSVPLALTTAQIGLALSAYSLLAAITQPLFGWLADKVGTRWLGPGSVAWTIGFLMCSIWIAQTSHSFALFVLFFSLAALGSGAFHPMATMHSTTAVVSLAAMGTGIFFLFGQGGLAAGPVLAGFLLDHVGPLGFYILAIAASPFIIFMAFAMRHTTAHPAKTEAKGVAAPTAERVRWGALAILALITAARAWAFLGTVNFIPKMFQDRGWSSTEQGMLIAAYWIVSGVTGVIGGGLADRWGRRQLVFVTLLFGSLPIYFLPLQSGWLAFVPIMLSGSLLGASHSTLLVIAQALLPGRQAFASGVTLGYLFGMGAIAAWIIGLLADQWGLTPAIQIGTGVGIAGAWLALFLPKTREVLQLQSEGAVS